MQVARGCCTVPMFDTKDHVDRISSIALLFTSLANNVHCHRVILFPTTHTQTCYICLSHHTPKFAIISETRTKLVLSAFLTTHPS